MKIFVIDKKVRMIGGLCLLFIIAVMLISICYNQSVGTMDNTGKQIPLQIDIETLAP